MYFPLLAHGRRNRALMGFNMAAPGSAAASSPDATRVGTGMSAGRRSDTGERALIARSAGTVAYVDAEQIRGPTCKVGRPDEYPLARIHVSLETGAR